MDKSPFVPDPYAAMRDYFRLTVSLPMDYQLEGEEAQGPPNEMSLNLSGGGVGFITKRRFDIREILALTIMLPMQPPITVKARIVRAEPLEVDPTVMSIGVRFTTLDRKDRERLLRYILQVQIERRRDRYNV